MKKFARISALMLALVMMLSMFASCGTDPAGNPSDTTKAPDSGITPDTDDKGEEKILPNLPEIRYDGYDYRIRVKGEATYWSTIGIDAEQKTGEPINDSALERNSAIEEKYGVTVSVIEGGDVGGAVVQTVLTQVDEFDLAIINPEDLGQVAPKSVYDLNQLQYIDLEKPWYDQNFNKEVSIGGRLYSTTGDLVLNDDNGTWAILFNKTLTEDFTDIPNLYQLALDGKWTLDKLYEYAKIVASDITGDQVMDENDRWGFQTESFNLYATVAASGEKIASKDANDMPYLTANTERFQDVFTKTVNIYGDKSVSMYYNDYTTKYSGYDFFIGAFNDGRVLMKMSGLYDLTLARDMDDEVGVLPMPKYDESQPTTKNPITVYNATCVCIPISVGDVERTSILTEAMFAESRYTTRVAFYEQTLKKKYSPDEETKLVLDQVIENRTYDLGIIYGWGGVLDRISSLMENRATNFASSWKSLERVAQRALEQTIKDFNKAQNAG